MPEEDTKPAQAGALRAARKALRMSQGHLAQAAGVSDRTVRRAEAGHVVTDEVLRSLCAVLGLDASGFGAPEAVKETAPEWRAIPEFEFSIRAFVFALTKLVGGLHPLFSAVMFMVVLEIRAGTLAFAVLSPVAMWVFSRNCGATPREAFAFLRGRAFVDGTPVHLEERIEALRNGLTVTAAKG